MVNSHSKWSYHQTHAVERVKHATREKFAYVHLNPNACFIWKQFKFKFFIFIPRLWNIPQGMDRKKERKKCSQGFHETYLKLIPRNSTVAVEKGFSHSQIKRTWMDHRNNTVYAYYILRCLFKTPLLLSITCFSPGPLVRPPPPVPPDIFCLCKYSRALTAYILKIKWILECSLLPSM